MLPGVKHIRIQADLVFDNDYVVSLSSPVWTKDIREGLCFSDEQISDILAGTGMCLAEIIEKKTSTRIYSETKARKTAEELPPYLRKPDQNNPFSIN